MNPDRVNTTSYITSYGYLQKVIVAGPSPSFHQQPMRSSSSVNVDDELHQSASSVNESARLSSGARCKDRSYGQLEDSVISEKESLESASRRELGIVL